MTLVHPTTTEAERLPGADPKIPPPPSKRPAQGGRLVKAVCSVAWASVGGAVVVALWSLVALSSPDLPTPSEGFAALRTLLRYPFYDLGPNDKGIGIQLGVSLIKVFTGFAMATLVGVPLGFLIGGSKRAWAAANPIIQVLRPVSPLAWFPIGLVVLKDVRSAAVFVIFITSLRPTVINTAAGAASVPMDQRNVARVFKFGRLAYVRHVVIPHSLPAVITGMRLSMGIAWMVIVAAEMLSGNTGIGYFVWNSYNGGSLANVISAIVLIGTVGVLLDTMFMRLARKAAA
ncbi:MAG: nitrate ABC transporter permease [Actinomycetota bacterium]|nr:nitrate ABC transporter permease [Actinomycetota bacterium]